MIYQPNKIKKIKKDYKKKLEKVIKIFLKKKKKKKNNNMVVNVTKIFQRIKSKSLLSIGKKIIELEKNSKYSYKKVL